MMTIGESIRAVREAKGFTRRELYEKSGVHYQTIYNWEHDGPVPTVFNLICIADVLDVSLDELVGRERRN